MLGGVFAFEVKGGLLDKYWGGLGVGLKGG